MTWRGAVLILELKAARHGRSESSRSHPKAHTGDKCAQLHRTGRADAHSAFVQRLLAAGDPAAPLLTFRSAAVHMQTVRVWQRDAFAPLDLIYLFLRVWSVAFSDKFGYRSE